MVAPVPLDSLEQLETGFASVYLSRNEVFKMRRPVRLSLADEWVDLTTPDRRRAACLEEARIGEGLSPDVVRGVVPVTCDRDGRRWFRGDGRVVDWALCMRRLPDADRADRRLEAEGLEPRQLRAVAHRLARFHERARGEARVRPEDVLDALRARITLRIDAPDWPRRTPLPAEANAAEAWQGGFLEAQSERLLARAKSDSIREGHGELALDHVFLDGHGGVEILAGLEMSPRFRDADIAADVALLATDLAVRHRADLAEHFVAEYARLANDFDLNPLLDFYASLRAAIRAKLDWLCADRGVPGSKREQRYRERARRFFALAVVAPRRALLPPSVVAMGGQVASGKSTVALHIARRISAPVVGSDATRDHLLGARLNQDLHEARWEEAYEAGFGERVYTEVLRRAAQVLESGRPVVIDGCFRSRAQRQQARALAKRYGLPFLFVEAQVTPEIQLERLAERARRDAVPIEEWKDIADAMRRQWEPAIELDGAEHLPLDTGGPLDQNARAIEERLPTWPVNLTG